MTPDDVRAAAEQLVDFHERFAPLFGKEQAQDHAYDYLKGLMVCPERKSIEPIALLVGHGDVSGLQKFVGAAPWAVRRRAWPRPRPSSPTSWSPRRPARPVGVVGVDRRVGLHQEGVALRRGGAAAQRPARQGGQLPGRRLPDRGDPGRVGPAGPPAVPARVVVRSRRARRRTGGTTAHIPEDVTFRTKPQIAAELIRDVAVLGQVELDWVVADEEYGRAGHFLDELETAGAAVRARGAGDDGVFWTADPAGCIPAYSGRGRDADAPRRGTRRAPWPRSPTSCPPRRGRRCRCARGRRGRWSSSSRRCGSGAMRHRKPGPPSWLLIRRSLGAEPELKYYISNADAETPLSTLALVACTRCRVEEFFEDCKSYLGMAQYETRSWVGWHHHMTLVGLAHLFVTLARRRLQKKRRS